MRPSMPWAMNIGTRSALPVLLPPESAAPGRVAARGAAGGAARRAAGRGGLGGRGGRRGGRAARTRGRPGPAGARLRARGGGVGARIARAGANEHERRNGDANAVQAVHPPGGVTRGAGRSHALAALRGSSRGEDRPPFTPPAPRLEGAQDATTTPGLALPGVGHGSSRLSFTPSILRSGGNPRPSSGSWKVEFSGGEIQSE